GWGGGVLAEVALEQPFHLSLVGRRQPALFDEQVGQGRVLACRPKGAGLDELLVVDQVELKGQDAEEEIAVRVHGRPRQRQRWGWRVWRSSRSPVSPKKPGF